MSNKPVKRSEYLQPLSRDHHHALLLCWKIKTGIKNGTEAERIKTYAEWFYHKHLHPHFEAEEKYVFPVIGSNNDLIKKALSDHRQLNEFFKSDSDLQNQLSLFADLLELHIRFEERILFNEIQEMATQSELKLILQSHSEYKFTDNLNDPFWENK